MKRIYDNYLNKKGILTDPEEVRKLREQIFPKPTSTPAATLKSPDELSIIHEESEDITMMPLETPPPQPAQIPIPPSIVVSEEGRRGALQLCEQENPDAFEMHFGGYWNRVNWCIKFGDLPHADFYLINAVLPDDPYSYSRILKVVPILGDEHEVAQRIERLKSDSLVAN